MRRAPVALALGALLLISALGCRNGNVIPPSDAGTDAGDANRAETAVSCTRPFTCVGDEVHKCVKDGGTGVAGGLVEVCAAYEKCSRGRCVSPECAIVEGDRSAVVGCEFHTVQPETVEGDDNAATSLLVTNQTDAGATVWYDRSQPDAAAPSGIEWVPVQSAASLDPAGVLRLDMDGLQLAGPGLFLGGALRILSTRPVTVALIQGDDTNQGATTSSGGTLVLPDQSLGNHYVTLTYGQDPTPDVLAVKGGRGGAARFVIVGTQADTSVKIDLPPGAIARENDGPPLSATASFERKLGEGQVLQIYSAANGTDLSGTNITANFPVAVYAGNLTSTYGLSDLTKFYTPDMAHEQMPPVRSWSKSYVAANLLPQSGVCDSLLGEKGSSIWRILAFQDDTEVSFLAPESVQGLPSSLVLLDAGQIEELIVWGGSFLIEANHPVLVTQGIDCEASLSLAVPTERLLRDLRFAALPNFDQLLAVVRASPDPVYLDDMAIDDAIFESVGKGFQVAHVPLPPCPPSLRICPHRLRGRFGVTLRGMDVVTSYALTAHTSGGCADPTDNTCVD
jgi:hypothetical protein